MRIIVDYDSGHVWRIMTPAYFLDACFNSRTTAIGPYCCCLQSARCPLFLLNGSFLCPKNECEGQNNIGVDGRRVVGVGNCVWSKVHLLQYENSRGTLFSQGVQYVLVFKDNGTELPSDIEGLVAEPIDNQQKYEPSGLLCVQQSILKNSFPQPHQHREITT